MAFPAEASWAFVAIGVATQGIALLLARRPIRLLRAGGSARGTVLDAGASAVQGARGAARTFYFPVVGFTTRLGERMSFTSRTGQGREIPKGSDVRVIYDPAKPQEAELATFKALWFFPTVVTVFGLPFFLGGIRGLL